MDKQTQDQAQAAVLLDCLVLCEFIIKMHVEATYDEKKLKTILARYGYDLSEDGYYDIVHMEEDYDTITKNQFVDQELTYE